ncbi:MAG: SsrA-binding protein SmpB [Candidatus Adiutrix sp.]|jgi:SsrA-binding protein|nr:SsrA-binding protein SmpB [Candidatus Adiutrix sp.]
MSKKEKESVKIICQNKKARREYELMDRYEAGLVLTGTEVKSLRLGKANLTDAYARVVGGEAWLLNAHISPYPWAYFGNHDPLRKRKLLLRRQELKRLYGLVQERGHSLIPLKLYFKDGLAKAELALARGKKTHDKRQALKEADAKREMARALRESRK